MNFRYIALIGLFVLFTLTGCGTLSAFAISTCDSTLSGSSAESICSDLEDLLLADEAEETPAE